MKITKRREVILEHERRVTIRFKDASAELFCLQCQKITAFLTVDQAAVLKHSSEREIFRLVENGHIHFEENKYGRLLVCFASLLDAANEIILPDQK